MFRVNSDDVCGDMTGLLVENSSLGKVLENSLAVCWRPNVCSRIIVTFSIWDDEKSF